MIGLIMGVSYLHLSVKVKKSYLSERERLKVRYKKGEACS